MEKAKYVQPSAEIIDIDVEDIITASKFDDTIEGSNKYFAIGSDKADFDTLVNEGKIKLK